MLIEAVRSTIARYGMLEPGDSVVVAVSGGADSVALLHVLFSMRSELRISLLVAHLNHSIRGAAADADAEFVGQMASSLGLDSLVEKIDVPALARERKLGIEDAARQARYAFLERTAGEKGASKIATAHTADDQAETMLLNIIRGCGPDGLAGMPPVRGQFIRPLIESPRSEVEAYLIDNHLAWRVDATNEDTDYTRNRVRHRLLPLLQSDFNPRIREALSSLSALVGSENEFATAAAQNTYRESLLSESADSVDLDASVLKSAHVALQRRCVRMAIELVKGDLRDVEYCQVERILEALDSGQSVTFTLPSGRVYARVSVNTLVVFRRPEIPILDFERVLTVPGITQVPELRASIEVVPVPTGTRPSSVFEAVIDAAKISGKLSARTWRDGDRIVPLGMTGHKKLQDIFTDKKVPRETRGLVPIIADEEKIIWVAGLAMSADIRLTDSSHSALLIRCLNL